MRPRDATSPVRIECQCFLCQYQAANGSRGRSANYLSTFPYLKSIWKDKEAGLTLADVDETAWCACFVNWCLIKSGRAAGPSAKAKDWLNYGTPLDTPVPGAITVIYKKPKPSTTGFSPSGYHVGFYVSGGTGRVTLLGGNQSNMVCQKTFVGHNVQGYRWPP